MDHHNHLSQHWKISGYNPELFVVDEAHRICVTTRNPEEESLFRSLLNYSAKKYLFTTAIEKVLKQDEEDQEIWYSMDSSYMEMRFVKMTSAKEYRKELFQTID